MEPAGIILTYIVWTNWKELPFNLSLFLFQLAFLTIGKIIGKVEVEWGEIWHAAQASHVRLCLEKVAHSDMWRYANFGYRKMTIQPWRLDQCDGKRFEYRRPTFETSPEFIKAMQQYAYDQVGKGYDTAQLFSYGLNFIVWLFWWPLWGREVFRWLNLRGGREVCSSGVTACLRDAEKDFRDGCAEKVKMLYAGDPNFSGEVIVPSRYFEIYHTAMVSPCLIAIDENWRKG